MKKIMAIAVLAIGFLGAETAAARSDTDKAAAQQVATSWVAMTDASKYTDSWDKGGAMMQAMVTREQLDAALTQVRTPLGHQVSRHSSGSGNPCCACVVMGRTIAASLDSAWIPAFARTTG